MYHSAQTDFIEAVAEAEVKMPLRLLELRPGQFVILVQKIEHSVLS